jgi:hypothetical protein
MPLGALMNTALGVDSGLASLMQRHSVLASLMAHECTPCSSGPFGKDGHGALRYVMVAPDLDRSFFRCNECGERWIRSAGMTSRFRWNRYKAGNGSAEGSGAWDR